MKLADYADDRHSKFQQVKAMADSDPDSKEYWKAYCAFVDADTELRAAIARADRANGTWELKVVK